MLLGTCILFFTGLICCENFREVGLHFFSNLSGKSPLIYKLKIVSEYDQEIPQSQTADNPIAPQGRAAQPSRDTRKTN